MADAQKELAKAIAQWLSLTDEQLLGIADEQKELAKAVAQDVLANLFHYPQNLESDNGDLEKLTQVFLAFGGKVAFEAADAQAEFDYANG